MTIWATLLATAISTPQPAPSIPPLRFAAYLRSGVTLHLAPSQSIGGLGGGAGVRFLYSNLWVAQADCNYFTLVGHVGEVRFGAGIQRPGLWSPAALGTISILFGERLSFRTADHPWPGAGPVVTGGIVLAPLRFIRDNQTISVLELGIGAKPDFPGVGLTYSIGILEIGRVF
ncbi:MAG TPA: hypothetical protein PK156_03455 [Polyangium sp.]|nr:hypothetical protein [Polyangium sp.]